MSGDETKDSRNIDEEATLNLDDIATEAIVVDSQGQRLSLSIENVVGGGGQRRISVFCPFWIVNLTEHSLKYKHDSNSSFVSGTIDDSENIGPKQSSKNYPKHDSSEYSTSKMPDPTSVAMKKGTIFAGAKGALATSDFALSLGECSLLMSNEFSIEAMSALGFMFNFHELPPINQRKIFVQLSDKDYTSDWSDGVKLEAVGVRQHVAMVSTPCLNLSESSYIFWTIQK